MQGVRWGCTGIRINQTTVGFMQAGAGRVDEDEFLGGVAGFEVGEEGRERRVPEVEAFVVGEEADACCVEVHEGEVGFGDTCTPPHQSHSLQNSECVEGDDLRSSGIRQRHDRVKRKMLGILLHDLHSTPPSPHQPSPNASTRFEQTHRRQKLIQHPRQRFTPPLIPPVHRTPRTTDTQHAPPDPIRSHKLQMALERPIRRRYLARQRHEKLVPVRNDVGVHVDFCGGEEGGGEGDGGRVQGLD